MALEGLTLNGLSLNNGTTHMLTALQLPIPAKKPEWVEGADANGAILMRDPLVENGTLVATVDLIGSTKAQALSLIGAIVDELEEADRNPAGVPVVWTPAGGGLSMTFYALSGEVTQLENDIKFTAGNVPTVQVTLKCRPGGYGDEVSSIVATGSDPALRLPLHDVLGDMPTDEAYIVVTDLASQARRHVEWGAEYLHYNHADRWPTWLTADALGPIAGTGTTAAGAWFEGTPLRQAIKAPALSQTVAMLSAAAQEHIGTFRVKARVRGTAMFRFAWRPGDNQYTTNDWATPPWAGSSTSWYEIDLGLISIPPAEAGAQTWDGRLEIKLHPDNPTPTTIVDAYVNYMLFIPVEAGYGRARTTGSLEIGAVMAYDNFGTATGAVTGDTLDAGGTWTTAGSDADDFTTSTGVFYATRTAVSDADSLARFATAAAAYTDVYVSSDVRLVGTIVAPTSGTQFQGVAARWVDQSNWCAAGRVAFSGTTGRLVFAIAAAGGISYLYSAGGELEVQTANLWWTIGLAVTAAGEWTVHLNGTPRFTGTDSRLATGGTLASGKAGIYDDYMQATALERQYTNFQVSQLTAPSPVIYSGRTFEVTGHGTRRQNSAGTVYGQPGSYRGSRFLLSPAGSADRSTSIAAKAHRNDPDIGGVTTVGDNLKLQVFYRPRYSVVPR